MRSQKRQDDETGATDFGVAAARLLQIRASRLATAIFAGEYASAFRGRGIEFDQVREYQPGDDVRSIDWNVTARLGRPYIKRFIEERELTVIIVIDRSPSMDFGTVRATKLATAVEAASLLAFAALRCQDRTGLLSFGDGSLRYLAPGKGRRHTLRLVMEAAEPRTAAEGDGLAQGLVHLQRTVKSRSVICLLSDFLDPVPVDLLAALAARHDVVAAAVADPAETELPDVGLISLHDPETGKRVLVDAADCNVRRRFTELSLTRSKERRTELLRTGADYLPLGTELSPLHQLMVFFHDRCRRRGL